jgi:cytochrome P450
MEHMTRCLKETLRIHSTVGGLIPKITTNECYFDGVKIPKGTVVYLPG